MRIVREYAIDIDEHYKITLFDEDIDGQSEGQIRERIDRMVHASPPVVRVTRLWMPALDGFDIDSMTDDEIHEKVQGLLDGIRDRDPIDDHDSDEGEGKGAG